MRLILFAALAATTTCGMATEAVGLRTTRQGTLYRVVSSEDAAPVAKPEYRILEREQDDLDVASRQVSLTIRTPTPLREAAALVLADSEMAVRFTGTRAMDAAARPVGPAIFSGALRGALNSLAQQAGLQVYIRERQVEFTDRRSYQLQAPAFENVTDLAAKIQMTRAANVRIAGGAVEFDADPDGLRDVQNAIREVKAGRRGAGTFLAGMSKATTKPAPAGIDPTATAKRAEEALVAAMQSGQAGASAARAPQDPLQRAVSLEFDGDVTEAIRRLAQEARIDYKIAVAPTQYTPITLRLTHMPLKAAMDAVDRQLNGKGDLVYVKSKQRLDFVAR